MLDLELPPGFKFHPTDETVITSYLLPKALGKPLPWSGLPVKDIYGQYSDPWKVFTDQDRWWQLDSKRIFTYAFAKLTRLRGKMIGRNAGSGTWHESGKITIKNNMGQTIGFKRALKFLPDALGNNWIMHEFSLADVSLKDVGSTDIVMCMITKDKPVVTAQDFNGEGEIRELREGNKCESSNGKVGELRKRKKFEEQFLGFDLVSSTKVNLPANKKTSCDRADESMEQSAEYSNPLDQVQEITNSSCISMVEVPCVAAGIGYYDMTAFSPSGSDMLSDRTFFSEDDFASVLDNFECLPISDGMLETDLCLLVGGPCLADEFFVR